MDKAQLTSKELSNRLSKRLANFKLKDETITKLADRVLIDGLDLKKFDVCIYGICIDYFTDRIPKLDPIFTRPGIARIEVFPYGIIDWDRFHIRVSYGVEELEGQVRAGGAGR